ncbi:MAG: glycoside hydrolase family 95 protein, partial [Bacteroidia bacterium]|nr:glycoside hydrolase family 95 protein [Bacteroidia bacterium]
MQKALFENQYARAFKIADKKLLGTPPRIRSYQPLGDLLISYKWAGTPDNYRRELNLETGIALTSFTADGKSYTQEVFVSAPDNILVVHIKSSDHGFVNASFTLSREQDAVVKTVDGNTLVLTGQIIDKDDPLSGPGGEHMKFAGELRLTATNGLVEARDGVIEVKGAEEVIVRLTAATDYNINLLDFDRSINPEAVCKTILEKSAGIPLGEIKKRHIEEHSGMFNRVSLSLGADTLSAIPTDERLAAVKDGGTDNGLITLYFQYGRYLLMGSSRAPAILPANLQGIWNKDMNAAWNSDFHTNINLQMNYWP